jgi:acyl dehydratase
LQGHPRTLAAIVKRYIAGMPTENAEQHPFRRKFHDLPIGYQLKTKSREITLDDIEHFAHFTGDTFYAHMDEAAAKANPPSAAASRTGISSWRLPQAFSWTPIQARCSRTMAWTICASSNP